MFQTISVYVDGSFFPDLNEAGAGIYFGEGDGRNRGAPVPYPRDFFICTKTQKKKTDEKQTEEKTNKVETKTKIKTIPEILKEKVAALNVGYYPASSRADAFPKNTECLFLYDSLRAELYASLLVMFFFF